MSDYLSPTYTHKPIDVRVHMKHLHVRPMPHSCGHNVASDFADYPAGHEVFGVYKNCGMLTADESNLLFAWASKFPGGDFLDIGSHTGLSAMTLASVEGSTVIGVEPMLNVADFKARFKENTAAFDKIAGISLRSDEFYEACRSVPSLLSEFDGVLIDGDHVHPNPVNDAILADKFLRETGFIAIHDAFGADCWWAFEWLLDHGYKGRFYDTPHGFAFAWRGDLEPVPHTPDPLVDWAAKRLATGSDFGRCV